MRRSRFPKANRGNERRYDRQIRNRVGMNSVTDAEPRGSARGLPKHRRNRSPRSWFGIGHRCHFVNHRLFLATQTTIESVRTESTASARTPRRPVGNEALFYGAALFKQRSPTLKQATTSATIIR